jgi:hypothetical protein
MKRILFVMFAMFGLLVLGGSTLPSGKSAAAPRRESAVVEFAETVRLGGVLLRGQYLVVHDEERMARGEPCTYIYSGDQENKRKLVTSFHCIHVERERAEAFKVTFAHRFSIYQVPEIAEIQFAGSKDGHQVP